MDKPIRKAVLPVAGLGTRFLPATKAIPKEMLTVVDRPILQHVVDEAREAGIAYALCGVLRAIPHHAARRKLFLPMDLLDTVKLSPDDVFAGHGGAPSQVAGRLDRRHLTGCDVQ